MPSHAPTASIRALRLAGLLLGAGLGLAACQQRSDDPTLGQRVDKAVAETKEGAREAKADIKEAAQDAKNAGARTADKMEANVSDASITASINAELAKDSRLSALKINVDTQGGRVALSGSAPDEQARQRATELAAGVKGVLSVDNRLTVDARS
ncbi:BON domain-containing protein [Roseateles violae]|uniref:BON domain-containing protein n=1 Tax=Roseateles violae TaxID=3058042 RepID=A0ABT8DWE1_9BURK|nr:BON domain-containing protein [Pelomonas sp. PFR6]MDN3922614.1 BON domain-containing protein [Pelomonas sp. PFR6]